MPTQPAVPNVPIGPSTIAGYGSSAVTFVLAVIALVTGDGDDQTLGVIIFGLQSILSFVVTQIGRYWQAREIAARTPLGDPEDLLPGDELDPDLTDHPPTDEVPVDEGDPNPPPNLTPLR